MQSAYISSLLELAEKDNRVLHVLADSGTGYDEMFRRNFPNQIYNFGISEEHMVAAAAGMATAGKIPFVFTAGAFLAYRSLEFIRDDVCFQNLNVKIIGMGSGLAWSTLGPTHHTTEDIAVLRAIPNLMILSPSTPAQVSAAVKTAYEHKGPVYIRIGMNKEREFFEEGYKLNPGTVDFICEENMCSGKKADVSVFTTGSILGNVYDAVGKLREAGKCVWLINVPSIKPFDSDKILELAEKSGMFAVVEEHNIYGGLASIISDVLSTEGVGKKIIRIGLEDTFAVGYGTEEGVRKQNGLDADSIYSRILKGIGE